MELTEFFMMFIITSGIAFCLKLASFCYKSKCRDVDFCCIHIKRDTALEEREVEFLATNASKNQRRASLQTDNNDFV